MSQNDLAVDSNNLDNSLIKIARKGSNLLSNHHDNSGSLSPIEFHKQGDRMPTGLPVYEESKNLDETHRTPTNLSKV